VLMRVPSMMLSMCLPSLVVMRQDRDATCNEAPSLLRVHAA